MKTGGAWAALHCTVGSAAEQLAGASPRRPNPPRFLNPRPWPLARAYTYLLTLQAGCPCPGCPAQVRPTRGPARGPAAAARLTAWASCRMKRSKGGGEQLMHCDWHTCWARWQSIYSGSSRHGAVRVNGDRRHALCRKKRGKNMDMHQSWEKRTREILK